MKVNELLNFVSPVSNMKLFLENEILVDVNVNSGELITSDRKEIYEIKDYIPRFVPLNNYSNNFGFQWNKYCRTQLDSYAGITLSLDRIKEVTGKGIDSMNGKRILEAGSGAGRFTEILLKTSDELYSFDYSSAVDANLKNNGVNVNLFQASIYEIPLKKHSFDIVFCLGVIQHTPFPEKTFYCLSDQVKSGGKLYVDIYEKRPYTKLTWKYILRPLFRLFSQNIQYALVRAMVFIFLPFSTLMGKIFGNIGFKLFPIANFNFIPFKSYKDRYIWSVLDTFDWFGPTYDLPQTKRDLENWFSIAGFKDFEVFRGSNGIIGRGTKV